MSEGRVCPHGLPMGLDECVGVPEALIPENRELAKATAEKMLIDELLKGKTCASCGASVDVDTNVLYVAQDGSGQVAHVVCPGTGPGDPLDMPKSLEQWARDILELAVKERLVRMPSEREWGGGPHPQARSAGELVAVANMLKALVVEHDAKWQGHAHGTHPRPGEPAVAMPERRVNTCSNGACGLNYYDHNATLCPRCSQCAECRSAKERGMVPLHTWLPNGNNAHSEVSWRG